MQKSILLALVWLAFFQGKPPVRTIQFLASSEVSSCSLPAPANIQWTEIGTAFAFFEWDAVSGAAYYRVKVFQTPSNTLLYTRLVTADPKRNGVLINDLGPATSFIIVVYSVCSNGIESPKPN